MNLTKPAGHPVSEVKWVPWEQVRPNTWNPNQVAPRELGLLAISIKADGYTQPVVTIWDPETKTWIVVDGFHRYFVMGLDNEIKKSTGGLLPIVEIKGDINQLMASTIRHNRARGKHSVDGMAKIAFEMLENGWQDHDICNEIGMEPEELIRLKHITGFSRLFEDMNYRLSWETRTQVKLRQSYEENKS